MLRISCFVSIQAGKGSGGAGGGFGDREGRGRREEDPDAGRSVSKYSKYSGCWQVLNILNIPDAGRSASQIFQISSCPDGMLLSRSDQSDDWRRGPPPPQREGYQVKNFLFPLTHCMLPSSSLLRDAIV